MSGPGKTKGRRSRIRARFALCAITAAIAVPSLFTRDLWNPDEPRYAEVAREMRVLGKLLIPHLNAEVYAEKPPLFFWLSAALQQVGLGFASGRLIVALCFLGTLFLTLDLGEALFDPVAGRLGALVLATMNLFLWVGKAGVLDVPLTFFTTLALWGFVGGRGRFPKRRFGDTLGARHRGWMALFWIGMGLGTLVKGPVAILIPCLGAAAFLVIEPHRTEGPRDRSWVWGIALMAAIVLVWLVPALIEGGKDYRDVVLFKQNVGRMWSSWSHRQPVYYYLVRLPVDLFPWGIVLPAAAAWVWRSGRDGATRSGRALLVWAAAGLLFFSLVSGKRERYLLPFYPPVAIVIGGYLASVVERGGGAVLRSARKLLRVELAFFAAFGLAFAVVAVAGPALSGLAEWDDSSRIVLAHLATPMERTLALVAGAVILGAVAAALALARKRRLGGAVAATGAAALLFSLGCDLVALPALDLVKSPRRVSEVLNRIAPIGESAVALYPNGHSGAFHLYTGRVHMPVLEDAREIDPFLAGPGRRVVLMTEDIYRRDREAIGQPYTLTPAGFVGHSRIVLLEKTGPDSVPACPPAGAIPPPR